MFFQVSETEVGRGIRTRRWKYYAVAPDADGWNDPGADRYVETALYDLDHDPYKLENLIGLQSTAELAAALSEILVQRMATAGEPTPVIEPAPIGRPGRPLDPRGRTLDTGPMRFGHQPK